MTKEEALEVSRATAELLPNLGNQLRSPVSEIRNLTSVRLALAAIEDETEYLRKVHRSPRVPVHSRNRDFGRGKLALVAGGPVRFGGYGPFRIGMRQSVGFPSLGRRENPSGRLP